MSVNSFSAGPGIVERSPEPLNKACTETYVCTECLSPVRLDEVTLAFFHILPGYPQLETIAKNVKPACKKPITLLSCVRHAASFIAHASHVSRVRRRR